MNKSLLVRDTPKNCSECQSSVFGFQCTEFQYIHSIKHYVIDKTIHPHCPLQDTTELLEALTLDIMSLIYNNHDILLYSEKLKVEDEVRIKLNKALGGESK